ARSTGAASHAVPALREAIRNGDPDVAVTAIGTASSLLAGPFVIVGSLGRGALYLGGLTLLLSMIGLFGVQSHVVAHRTREIGVRMSVGATARQIKLMVLKTAIDRSSRDCCSGSGAAWRAGSSCARRWSSKTPPSSIPGC